MSAILAPPSGLSYGPPVRPSARFSACLCAWVFLGCERAPAVPHGAPATSAAFRAASPSGSPAAPSSQPSAAPASVAPAPVAAGPRVYAKTRFVWIRPEPDASKQWIGYLWTGESAQLVSGKPVYGPGCMYWYAVEPFGYVCVDGLRATLDKEDAGFQAVQRHAADLSSAWPHQYGEAKSLTRLLSLQGSPLAFPGLPNSVHDSRTKLSSGSTVAYSSELTVGAESFLLGADLSYVPKSRVTPLPRHEFKGVELGRETKLPLAFFRGKARPKFRRVAGALRETSDTFPRLSHVALTGERAELEGEKFLETQEGSFVRESDAVVPKPSSKPPWGDTTPKGRGTWLEVSVTQGWLIAYEGETPVFTTLVSPGRGGPAKVGEDPIPEARTPLGSFPISGKFATATMEAPGNLIHTAVPWTQNFSGPHALHSAYWHDDWGAYKSGGCINLSPLDGKRIFEWSEPQLPAGWHGVRWLPWRGPATTIVVHR